MQNSYFLSESNLNCYMRVSSAQTRKLELYSNYLSQKLTLEIKRVYLVI